MPKNAQSTSQMHSSHMLVLKILQERLQQYMNHELPDVQLGLGQVVIYPSTNCTEPSDIRRKDGNTTAPGLLLRNLYAGQEATVRTGHGTTDWSK